MSEVLTKDYFKRDALGHEYAGSHILLDLWGASHLTDPGYIQDALERAVRKAGATILHSHYHSFGPGEGVSGVTVLSESHISIHTWPEREFASIDIFMCGECDPNKSIPVLEDAFQPSRTRCSEFRRGDSRDQEKTFS